MTTEIHDIISSIEDGTLDFTLDFDYHHLIELVAMLNKAEATIEGIKRLSNQCDGNLSSLINTLESINQFTKDYNNEKKYS